MAIKHFITTVGFIISYDDVKYQFNPYNQGQMESWDSPNWELVRLSTSSPTIQGYNGIGINVLDTSGITTGSLLNIPRLILP